MPLKKWRVAQAFALFWAYVTGKLNKRSEAKLIWTRGVFCSKPECGTVGQYWVDVDGKHWHCCRAHAGELMDLLAGAFTKSFRDMEERERRGEFLQTDTSRGLAVYKSRGVMGPSIQAPKALK